VYSIVIPAYNEEAVIGRCLQSLIDGMQEGELEIVVACNGCTDRTAELARGFGKAVKVVETSVASKHGGLNLGDGVATGFPRFYVDADVVLPLASVRRVAQVLEEGPWLAAAPRIQVDLSDRPWPVRAFYAVWLHVPYFRHGMIGSGVYAVSEQGRRRFGEFPGIIADDGYVRLVYAPEERTSVDAVSFIITPPRTLGGVIDIKTRSRVGTYELKRKFPELWRHEKRDFGSTFREILRHPSVWPAFPVYLFVISMARWRAYRRLRAGDLDTWERDASSREGSGATGRECRR
jgi:glycosyltransferase involved in cell wall biosynthesis